MARPVVALVLAAAFAIELFGLSARQTRDVLAWDGTSRRADKLIAAGRFADALPLVADAPQRHPRDVGALRQLGLVYAGLGRTSDEAAVWEELLANAPASDDACLRLSGLYMKLGQHERVVVTANRCLALNPHQAELLRDRAAALRLRSGRADSALEEGQ